MGTESYDVAVVGLGAMGSAAAYHLARKGLRVVGFDRFHPPHQHGSSHGRSRAIRLAYFENPAYVPLLHHAYQSWERLESDSGRKLLQRTGALMLGSPDSAVVAGSLRSAREHGLMHELLGADELTRRFPAFLVGDDTVGLLEEAGAVLFPEQCIEAQLELSRVEGVELRFDEPVESWRELRAHRGVEVVTGCGKFFAKRLVLAPGAWVPELLRAPSHSLAVSRQVQFWMEPAQQAESFRAPSFPFWVWAPSNGAVFYGFPSAKQLGPGIKVGIHTAGKPVSPDSVERHVNHRDLEEIQECLGGRVQWLEPAPIRSCVCLYTNSPDGHFVLGTHPRFPAVLLAAGFSGHGFKFANLVGEIVADLVLEGTSRHQIDLFDPRRPGLLLSEAW